MLFKIRTLYFIFSILIILSCLPAAAKPDQEKNILKIKKILLLNIDSSINPATFSYLKSGFTKAHNEAFNLILIKMNTPGGLVNTTKNILTLFGESDIPITVWVTPEGASATSAGAIIASGAHILVMGRGTNIGAATPVQLGQDIKQKDLKNKAINDLVALIRSLAETRGRNDKYFGQMVEEGSSFKATEAQKKGLINGIVDSMEDLSSLLNKTEVKIKGKEVKLQVEAQHQTVAFKMDLGQKLLNIFANPSMAYILFLIGAALLYLELQAPGGFIAGSFGVLCLILAGIGFQVLPLNFGALGLIVLSFVLFILEAYITSFGILSLAGMASLIIGSLFLYRTDNAYIEISTTFILSVASAVGLFLIFLVFFLLKDIRKIKRSNFNKFVGRTAIISEIISGPHENKYIYHVKISGEIWKATTEQQLEIGQECIITEQDSDSMILTIEKK